MNPAPRPDTECAELRAECDAAFNRLCKTPGGRGSHPGYIAALNLYIEAHDRWAVAFYGGDGRSACRPCWEQIVYGEDE